MVHSSITWHFEAASLSLTMAQGSEPKNFSWFVENKIAAFAYPRGSDMVFLANQGITDIVNLRLENAEHTEYSEKATEHNLKVHFMPITNRYPPSLTEINEFMDILQSQAKGPIGVHCLAGHGRTGTMLACYLVAHEGYSAEDAIAETRRRRELSIDNRAQEAAVHAFHRSLQAEDDI